MTINKDFSTSNRILCPPYLPTRPLKQQHTAKAIIEIDSFTGRTDYRRNQTCSLQKCQVPFSPPLWVCMRVSNIKGKHRFFGVCAVLLGGSYSRSGSRVLRPCLSHDVSCSLVLFGQPGDTNGCLSWEELKASTPCCSAEQSIIVCTWQVFFKHQEWARTWNWECFLLWLLRDSIKGRMSCDPSHN